MSKKATFSLPVKGYKGTAKTRDFSWQMDEPLELGGTDKAPTPMEIAMGALGGCIAITLRMYAQRKEWDLGEINVEINHVKTENNETVIHKKIAFGNQDKLTESQLKRLNIISSKCPVSKLIEGETKIVID